MRVFVSCLEIFLRLLRLLFLLLTLIYAFSPEMGFINHCNAALGKTVLSAGRNTSPLTAPAGRDAPGSRRGSGGRLLMIFAFYVCASATGLGPQGAVRTPPLSYFKPPPPGGNTRLPPAARAAERGRERGKAPRAGARQGEASPWVRGFRPPRTEPAPETPLSSFSLNRRLRVGPTRRISHSAFRVSATIRSVTAGRADPCFPKAWASLTPFMVLFSP